MAPPPDLVVIAPDRVARWMLAVIALLLAASIGGQVVKFFYGHDHVFGLVRLTYVDGEATIPSWYSSSALLLCAMVLALVAVSKRSQSDPDARYWLALTALFAYLSLDESAGIHETWGNSIRHQFAPTGFLSFAWVIPGAALVMAVTLIFFRFVWHLPAVTRRWFLLSGAVFVGSALGVEMITANRQSIVGTGNFTHSMLVTVEEAGEMVAIVMFLYGVLRYFAASSGQIQVKASRNEMRPAARQNAPQTRDA